jgi:competence protein ComEA
MKKWLVGLLAGLLMCASTWAAVDLNRATRSELEAVKGIGPAKARAIVEYRRKHGPFRNVEALADVKGFGKASVARLKGVLTVGVDTGKAPRKPYSGGNQ